jgi:hypothetical protein
MTELVPQFAETLLPIFTSVVVTAPLGEDCMRRSAIPAR